MASKEHEFFDERLCLMVAAIDFGTSHSGYAFSLKSRPDDIYMTREWGQALNIENTKTPTTVLISADKEFVSFGYRAEIDYARYCDLGEADNYELFRMFKMMLWKNKKLNLSCEIESVRGTKHNALDIFAMAMKYMKKHLLELVESKHVKSLQGSKIQWVLTIPAIWTDQAKQFMREAAFKAGLILTRTSKQLMFALEPEAASVYCRQKDTNFTGLSTRQKQIFPAGTKYMIVDAGGGTTDITAHEIKADGNMTELMCATGGDWGGSQIDNNFIKLLETLLGKTFINEFRRDHPSVWLDVLVEFEKKKKAVDPFGDSIIKISLSRTFLKKVQHSLGDSLVQLIEKSPIDGLSFNEGYLILGREVTHPFFTQVVDNITEHISKQLRILDKLDYILLVGGFGDSKFLFEPLQSEFSRVCPVLCPHSAGLAVAMGAVMFGHRAQVITARRARKTYGTRVRRPFIEGQHDPAKMVIDEDGKKRCKNLFSVYVTKNELIGVNSCKTFTSYPQSSSHTDGRFPFYSTDSLDPVYIDDPGVTEVGELWINLPLVPGKSKWDRPIQQRVYFGKTEIKVEIEDKSREGGEVVSAHIDFLGH